MDNYTPCHSREALADVYRSGTQCGVSGQGSCLRIQGANISLNHRIFRHHTIQWFLHNMHRRHYIELIILSTPRFYLFFLLLLSVWSLECYRCEGPVSKCQSGSDKSKVLECTPTNDRCYHTKITKIEAEDELDQGCTNEDGCGIKTRACTSSGDCKVTCCQKDQCNLSGVSASGIGNSASARICLVIAFNFGIRLLVENF